MPKNEWLKVVYASDCIYQDWDEQREAPECPECGGEYSDCECPGPGMDDIFDYKEIDGVLYAKKKN